MKFYIFLNEEDIIQKALNLPEPKIGNKYPSEKIKRYLDTINSALSAIKNKEENDTNDAIVQDLRDKKDKWSNVDKETKPVKTKQELPPEQQQEPEPEPEQPPERQQESTIKKVLEGKLRLGNPNSVAFKIVSFIQSWPDWYYSDTPRKQLISDLMKKFKLDKKKAENILKVNWNYKEGKITQGDFQDFVHMVLQGQDYFGF